MFFRLQWSTSSAALLGSMDNEGQPLWSHTVATDVPDVVACWKVRNVIIRLY